MRWRLPGVVALAYASVTACGLAGCHHNSGSGPAEVTAPPGAADTRVTPEGKARRTMFRRIVEDIRAYHLFPNAWPRDHWETQLPALESEVMAASTRAEVLVALSHLSGSLRDGHLMFTPDGDWDNPGFAVLPVSFFRTGDPLTPGFLVREADPDTGLLAGDELLSYDGMETANLLEHFRFAIDRASPGGRARRLNELLSWRRTQHNPGVLGSVVKIRVRRGRQSITGAATFQSNAPPPASTDTNPACAAPPREYGADYKLAQVTDNLCLYRGTGGIFTRYSIVRQKSFLYTFSGTMRPEGLHFAALQRDRETLRGFLAEGPQLSGVLLDLRDNHGGHHADYFLPWYLAEPFARSREWIQLHPMLKSRKRLSRALRESSAAEEYLRRASAGEHWWERSFRCGDQCASPLDEPVTRVPIALLVGPGCLSSCDTFVETWTSENAGPVVGEPSAAATTTIRYPLPIWLGTELIGELTIALSGIRSSRDAPWREGNPLPVQLPVERSRPPVAFEQAVIGAAIKALQHWPQAQFRAKNRP